MCKCTVKNAWEYKKYNLKPFSTMIEIQFFKNPMIFDKLGILLSTFDQKLKRKNTVKKLFIGSKRKKLLVSLNFPIDNRFLSYQFLSGTVFDKFCKVKPKNSRRNWVSSKFETISIKLLMLFSKWFFVTWVEELNGSKSLYFSII